MPKGGTYPFVFKPQQSVVSASVLLRRSRAVTECIVLAGSYRKQPARLLGLTDLSP